MTIRGYVDQAKTGDNQYATVTPVRESQHAIDVLSHSFFQEIADDAAESGSSTTSIVATAHEAIVGDRISWTSGNLDTREYAVLAVSTDAITTEPMAEAPAAADTFTILRPKLPVVDAQGQLSVGVSLSAEKGEGPITADTLRVTVATDDGVATDLSTIAGAVAGTEMQVDVLTSALPTGASTLAEQEAQTALLTTIDADTGSIATDMASLEAKDFATETSLAAAAASLASIEAEDFATETTLASVDSKLTRSNIAYTVKGKIAGASLTGSYATLLDPSSDLKVIYLINSCDNTILVSLDGGTTDSFELEAGESITVDLAANGMKFDNAVNISAKHAGAAPTTGSIRATGIG